MRGLGAGMPVVFFVLAIVDGPYHETSGGRAVHASDEGAGIPGRTLTLRADATTPAYEVVFRAPDGGREQRVEVAGGAAETSLAVPPYARRFVVRVGPARSQSQPLSIEGAGLTVVKISLRETAGSRLQRSLGLARRARCAVVLEPRAG
jgi:hypothetical protein